MTPLSIICIIMGSYYVFFRTPFVVAPKPAEKFGRFLFESVNSTRLIGIIWLIPWCVTVYFSYQSKIGISNLVKVWSTLGVIISLKVIIWAKKHRKKEHERLDIIASGGTEAVGPRLICLLTVFAGLYLIYLGIRVF